MKDITVQVSDYIAAVSELVRAVGISNPSSIGKLLSRYPVYDVYLQPTTKALVAQFKVKFVTAALQDTAVSKRLLGVDDAEDQ